MENLFRIIEMEEDSISQMFIFQSRDDQDEYLVELKPADYSDNVDLIGAENYKSLQSSKDASSDIKVFIVNETIFYDDSIDTVKRKIIKAMNREVSFGELYLFGLHKEMQYNFDIFEMLTQNDALEITPLRFAQFISNFLSIKIDDIDFDKEEFTYNDVMLLDMDRKEKIKKIPVGNRFFIEKQYPLCVNPFDMIEYDALLERFGDNIVSTKNKALLMSVGKLYGNNLYVCRAEKVLSYVKENDIPERKTVELYFPYLQENDIYSLDDLRAKKASLLSGNKDLLSGSFQQTSKSVQLFHDMYETKTKDLSYLSYGIQEVHCTIQPPNKIFIPLDVLIKIIHTNKNASFIKYNPGKGREKVYRLYSEKVALNGKKIPYLSKAIIAKHRLNVAREKSVAVVVTGENIDSMVITFFETGQISIEYRSKELRSVQEAERDIKENANPILDIVQDFMAQRGYTFHTFTTLYDPFIDVDSLQYKARIAITRKMALNKFQGCIAPMFAVIEPDLKKGIVMRYKRISYFSEMDSMDAFITERAIRRASDAEIVADLERNFSLSTEKATDAYTAWISNIQVEQNAHRNRRLTIKSNPGFLTSIVREKFTNNIMITVDQINDIHYLSYIPIYLDGIVRLTQDMTSSGVDKKRIDRVCGVKAKEEKDVIQDIESNIEEGIMQQEGFSFEDDEIEEDDLDDDGGILGLLEEGDDEDYEDMMGGAQMDTPDSGSDGFLSLEEGSVSATPGSAEGSPMIELEEGSVSATPEEEEGVKDEQSEKQEKSEAVDKDEGDEDKDEEEYEEFEEGSVSATPEEESEAIELSEGSVLSLQEMSEGGIEPSAGKKSSKKKSVSKAKKPKSASPPKKDKKEEKEDLLEEDITGLDLKSPNFFTERMMKRDPALFLKRKDGKFKAYTRVCPMNVRRQPVILTDKEKEVIDRENPGSYDQAIKYGSSSDKQYWYICPRYWCLKTNTSMTEADVKAGKCGGSSKIIPSDATKVPKDAFVYEFTSAKEHQDEDGNYIKHYPGFIKEGNHPDGLCIPCCFKTWDSPSQIKRRKKCFSSEEVHAEEIGRDEADEYIKGVDKFPLSRHRWGKMPLSIQKLLHTDNNKCFAKGRNTIKPFVTCMLRKGIEVNKTQSFVGVLADVYPEFHKEAKKSPPSIREMKEIIIDSISIDDFISYYRGNLISLFEQDTLSVSVEAYKDSKLAKMLDMRSPEHKVFFERVISAYQHFQDFLRDDEIVIDHTFLWDIASKPHPKLFPTGLNIALLEIPENDITNNVEIVCPTNRFSSETYSTKKPTILVMKKNEFYEPIYMFRDEEKNIRVHKTFSAYNSQLLSNIKYMLELIKKVNDKCAPKASMPRVYKFKENKFLGDILHIASTHSIKVIDLVMHYNGSIVGVMVKAGEGGKDKGFIPVRPSSAPVPSARSPDTPASTIMLDDVNWNDLDATLRVLEDVHRTTKGAIPCKPTIKILDDGLVVGILTETNQFVALERPEENIAIDGLVEQDGANYALTDVDTMTSQTTDQERVKTIKRIKLESNFFHAFRNQLRILLHKFNAIEERKALQTLLKDDSISYSTKLEQVRRKVKTLMKDNCIFTEIPEDVLFSLKDVTTCTYKCREKQYCMMVDDGDDGECKLMIPKKHLLSGYDNEEIYYTRMADQLIRYGTIASYMFKPNVYVGGDVVEYDVQDNEVILLDTILSEGYFNDLTESYQNKYILHSVRDFVEPQTAQVYETQFIPDELMKGKNVDGAKKGDKKVSEVGVAAKQSAKLSSEQCIEKTLPAVKGNWAKMFPSDTYEVEYKNAPACSFQLMRDIIQDHTKKPAPSVEQLKLVLIEKIQKLIDTYGEGHILRKIIKDQGKERLVRQVLERKVTLDTLILSSEYPVSNIDIILLSTHYKLPVGIISGTKLYELVGWNIGITAVRETKDNKSAVFKDRRKLWLVNAKEPTETYYFIRQPGVKRNTVFSYGLLRTKDSIAIQASSLPRSTEILLTTYRKRPTFEQYIKEYKPIISAGVGKKAPKKLVVDDSKSKDKSNSTVRKLGKKLVIQ